MKRLFFYVCVSVYLFLNQSITSAKEQDQLSRIKANYISLLVPQSESTDSLLEALSLQRKEKEMSDQIVVELHQRYPFDLNKIEGYITRMDDDGSWPDINYLDQKRSGWKAKEHTERILEMAKLYYSTATYLHRSEKVKTAIHKALNYWFTAKHRSKNWWYNEIGIPKTMGAAFVLLEEQLSEEEKTNAVTLMSNARIGRTGQNKIWLAGNVLIRALLQNDNELAQKARNAIAEEIVLGKKEGIQPDWSFHQHGSQQQFGNYGLAFISDMSFYYKLFKNTEYAFDALQTEILMSLINEGYKWVIWNRMMDVSSLGRQLFHNAQIHKAYGTILAAANMGIGGFPTNGNPLTGHKHFDNSDYTVHRSPTWMGSVKMASNRVIGTEFVNEDNIKGYYMGDGATYYYVRGDEYLNVFPFWDWRKIPGVTAFEDTAPIPNINVTKAGNRTDKVGGLEKDGCGMTTMELNRDGLKAYKTWLFTRDMVVCMGNGISSDSTLHVTTSIDQRTKQGPLEVLNGNKWTPITGRKDFAQKEIRFHHDRTGYIVIGNSICTAIAEKRTGRWCDFMGTYSPATVEGEVVSLHLSHGIRPTGADYLYIVLPDCEKQEIKKIHTNSIKVIRNDNIAQILSVPGAGKGVWIAAYEPTLLRIKGHTFNVTAPGIYYVEMKNGRWTEQAAKPFRSTK